MTKKFFDLFQRNKTHRIAPGFLVLCAITAALGTASLATPYIPQQDPRYAFTRGRRPGQFTPPPQIAPHATAAATPAAATTTTDETVELQHSDPMTSAGPAWQTWSNVITIAPGLEKMPLNFTVENGPGGAPKFRDMRLLLNKKPFLTNSDFNGTSTVSRNLVGTVGPGQTGLTIQAYGPAGAKLTWRLTTKKLVISGVKPNSFALTDKVTIEGNSLPTNPAYIKVFIGKQAVQVIKVQPNNQLQLQLPADLPGGKQDLIAVVGPLKSNAIQVTVKAAPHVYSVNFVSTAPGQPLVVSGKGFSTTASENSVTIGGVGATVVSATATSLTCTVPVDLPAPQWYVPIVVTTNGMPSTEKVTVNLGQRVIPNDGSPEL